MNDNFPDPHKIVSLDAFRRQEKGPVTLTETVRTGLEAFVKRVTEDTSNALFFQSDAYREAEDIVDVASIHKIIDNLNKSDGAAWNAAPHLYVALFKKLEAYEASL